MDRNNTRRRGSLMHHVRRGDIWDAGTPDGTRPVVVLTRNEALPLLHSATTVPVTSRIRGIASEVPLGSQHGLARECVANCDNVNTISQKQFIRRRGMLGPEDLNALDDALKFSLGIGNRFVTSTIGET